MSDDQDNVIDITKHIKKQIEKDIDLDRRFNKNNHVSNFTRHKIDIIKLEMKITSIKSFVALMFAIIIFYNIVLTLGLIYVLSI